MKQRMNLFKQLIQDSQKAAKTAKASANVKLGFHAYLSIAIFVICLTGIGVTYTSFRGDIKQSRAALQQARDELRGVMAQSDAISAEMAKLKAERAAAREAAGKTDQADQKLEDNWTSFLWKLASFTNSGVLIATVQLTRPQVPGSPQLGRSVVLIGRAKSLLVIRDWIERLTQAIPDYDFALDSQEQTDNKNYPISFRLSAKLL